MDTNDAILADLKSKSGSSKLEELRLDFDNILRDSQRPSELRVFSFQEEQGMTGVSLLGSKVSLPSIALSIFLDRTKFHCLGFIAQSTRRQSDREENCICLKALYCNPNYVGFIRGQPSGKPNKDEPLHLVLN